MDGEPTGSKGPAPEVEIDERGWALVDGELVPLAEAQLSVAAHGLNYGTGCFEGIRGYWQEAHEELYVLKLLAHFQRFARSAALLRIGLGATPEELAAATCRLLEASNVRHDVYIRPLAFKASRSIKVGLTPLRDLVAVYTTPLGDYLPLTGLAVQVSSWRRIPDNAIPSRAKTTGSYVNAALALDQAKSDGYDDAILLEQGGHVAEASAANLFMVRKGVLVTPPVSADILEGITRQMVLELADELAIPWQERQVDRTELYMADEIFLTGTGVQVAAVTSVDRRPVADGTVGPLTQRIQELFFRIVRGLDVGRYSWLTPVYGRALRSPDSTGHRPTP